MRVIIAGSRDMNYDFVVSDAMQASGFKPSVVVCGMARGVDMIGRRWAIGNEIKVDEYHANWKEEGRSAGYKRNVQMVENADALVAVWDGKSRGTSHMIDLAKSHGLEVYVYKPEVINLSIKAYGPDGKHMFDFLESGYMDRSVIEKMVELYKDLVEVFAGGRIEWEVT
jgi:hypothetical protein